MTTAHPVTPRRTQREVILAYLRDRGSITQAECLHIGGGSRLAAHILELRHAGFNLVTETDEVENMLGGISRVGRYVLGTPEQWGQPMKQLRMDGTEERLDGA